MSYMTEAESDLFNGVQDKYNRVSNTLSATFKRYNELEDLYFFHTPQSKRSSKSNVFDPMAYEQVEHMVAHLLSQDPRGEFAPTSPDDEIETEIMNELWKYQWNFRPAESKRKLISAGKAMGIYGSVWAITHWRHERVFSKRLNKFVDKWNQPVFSVLNPYDCYPDIDATTPEDMQFFIHDEYVTFDEIEAQNQGKEKRYFNLKELKEAINKDSAANVDNQYRNNMLTRRKVDQGQQQKGRIKLRRCYYIDRWVTIVPDHNMIIEDRPNPYDDISLPVSLLVDQDVPNMLLGIGEIDPVRTLMTSMNQLINMRLDNVKMIMEKPMIARKSAKEHMKTWKWGKNNVLVVNQDGDLKPIDIPDVTGNTFVGTLQYFENSIRSRSGRGDFLTSNRGNKTATEVDAMAAEQNARMNYKLSNIEQFIADISTKMMLLNQQFLSKETFVRIVGADAVQRLITKYADDPTRFKMKTDEIGFLRVSPDDIAGAFDFRVESGSTRLASTKSEIENFTTVLGLLGQYTQFYQMQGKEVDPTPIIETLISKLGVKNIDQIIKSINGGLSEGNQLFNGEGAVSESTGMAGGVAVSQAGGMQDMYSGGATQQAGVYGGY